jgi:7-cyano-7-deazaguanine synthase
VGVRSLLLLSGGIDSTCIAYWQRPARAVTIDYGQIAAPAEIRASRAVCLELDIPHNVITAPLAELGAGTMSRVDSTFDAAPTPEWWPFRNQFLITIGAAHAVHLGFEAVMIGTVAGDDVYADGRESFVRAMAGVLAMQEGNVQLDAPAVGLTTIELLRVSATPRELLGWTHSCHIATFACGTCRGCLSHLATLDVLDDVPAHDADP